MGDYDCSSSAITAWALALTGTEYAEQVRKATYTGNMRAAFLATGLFEWKPISFIASPGDLYLSEANHVAICQRQVPDELSEFSWGDNGAYGNKRGDQSGFEARVNPYYDYPWDGILHYNGKADSVKAGQNQGKTGTKTSTAKSATAKLTVDGKWGPLTQKELQRQLGAKVTGKRDRQTYGILRDRIGPKPATPANRTIFTKPLRKRLQKKLGVAQDGVVGKATVRALQRALNAGKVSKW